MCRGSPRCRVVTSPVLGMQKPRLLGVSDGVQVETLVPQSEGYMMAGTDASAGNP